jgi:hypothetical protein
MVLAFKCLHGYAPPYLSSLIQRYNPPRTRAVARDVFSGFFYGFFRRVFLLPRVGAGWANWVNGFGPGQPMGQKIFTGRVTARVKNRVKHTFFLQTLKNSLNFLIIFFFQQWHVNSVFWTPLNALFYHLSYFSCYEIIVEHLAAIFWGRRHRE